jgi:hypothetical protein
VAWEIGNEAMADIVVIKQIGWQERFLQEPATQQ